MAILDKRDIEILLEAGFDESELGLIPGGKRGIELYESPEDYFAKELIENACEQGECNLYDEILPHEETEPYDNDRPGLYENDEYPGNEDETIDVAADLREQVEWLKTINIGKMTLWQRRKDNFFDIQVKRVIIEIPQKEKAKMNRLSTEDRKEMWKTYAREAWAELWKDAVSSLSSIRCETIIIGGKKKYNLLIIDANEMRELGHKVPGECEWITMMYFEKSTIKPLIRPRSHL